MEKDKESFLDIITNYFSNLKDREVVSGDKSKISIPMEWIYTNGISREAIEKALINIICKANKGYKRRLSEDRKKYSKIDSLDIEDGNIVITAPDGWTKIVITNDSNLRGPFYAIDENRLYDEILRVVDYRNIGILCTERNWTMEKRDKEIKEFRKPENVKRKLENVAKAMAQAGHNLVEYHQYIMNKKRDNDTLFGIIGERTGKDPRAKSKENDNGNRKGNVERVSEIYDFKDRAEILEEMNPAKTILINQLEENSAVSKFAYATFVYENPRGKEGYLFVAEPFEGIHSTRMRFVPKEEYDGLEVNENKMVHIAQQFLEMSDLEFEMSRYSKKFNHTSIEKLREKYRRIILGEKTPRVTEESRYRETDRILYEGERRIGKTQMRKIAGGIREPEVVDIEGIINPERIKPSTIENFPNILQ